MALSRYVAGRLLQSAVLIFVVVTMCFALIHLAPGDPVTYLFGGQGVSPEILENMRHQWGLDRPWYVQYVAYVSNLAQGDLGHSQINRQPVSEILRARIPNTLLLMTPSLLISAVLGVLLGTAAARWPNSPTDYGIGAISLVGYSTPPFWLAIIMIVTFASSLRILPTQGMRTLGTALQGLPLVLDVVRHMILPTTVLAWWYLAAFTRLTRASALEECRKAYVTTARMKGLSEVRIFYLHVLRNACRPVVTILGLHLGAMLAGAVMVEVVFAWPGVGRLIFSAILQHDYPVVLGVFILVGVAVVLANLATDLLYVMLDPRIRYAE
jgi:peptide/nickel transport system permease protein